jgi:hypothetical protein
LWTALKADIEREKNKILQKNKKAADDESEGENSEPESASSDGEDNTFILGQFKKVDIVLKHPN